MEDRKVIEFFETENKSYWIAELKRCDWAAGQYLAQLLEENKLKDLVGETAKVLMLVEGKNLISFCTLAPLDDIQPTELTPWIGFVYTYPEYRGHRQAGKLLAYAENIAAAADREYIYISTEEDGLYEKYGYEFYCMEKDIRGEDSRIYRKHLQKGCSEQNGAI